MACPDWTTTCVLQIHTYKKGLGVALMQELERQERIIANRTLGKSEKEYSVTELENPTVKWGI